MNRSVAAALAIASVCALSLTGCRVQDAPRDKPPTAAAGVRTGGTLKVAITDPGSLSPLEATTPSAKLISRTLCDTLVGIDPQTHQLREGLLDSWVTADKGLFLTLRPLHDVKFTNGETLNAQDIAASFRELAAAVNGSPARALLTPFRAGPMIKPGQAPAGPPVVKEDLLSESGVGERAIAVPLNDYDTQIASSVPNPGLIRTLAEPALAPFSRKAFAADPAGFRSNPVCVGPYRLEKPYQSGDPTITLVRSKDYFAGNLSYSSGGTGYVDRIEFRIYPTLTAAFEAYVAGTVDVAPVPAGRLKDPTLEAADVFQGDFNAVEYLGIPTTGGSVLADPRVRRALSLAIDREQLAAQLGPAAMPATGFLPPVLARSAGRSGRFDAPAAALPQCDAAPARGDLTQAKALLSAAGVDPASVEVEIQLADITAPELVDLTKAVAVQWRDKLGVKPALMSYFWSAFEAADSGGGGIGSPYRLSWSVDAVSPRPMIADPQAYLSGLMLPETPTGNNWSMWGNERFKYLLSEQVSSEDPIDQTSRVDEAAGILCAEMPLIPLVATRPTWVVRSDSVGLARPAASASDGQPLLRELWLGVRG